MNPNFDIRTCSELLTAIKRRNIPDISYDLDKDGVVGPDDYFLARRFDEGNKGFITSEERERCMAAISSGLKEEFLWNVDGFKRTSKIRIIQKRGQILVGEDTSSIPMTYPVNSVQMANVRSLSELKQKRKTDSKSFAVDYLNSHINVPKPYIEKERPPSPVQTIEHKENTVKSYTELAEKRRKDMMNYANETFTKSVKPSEERVKDRELTCIADGSTLTQTKISQKRREIDSLHLKQVFGHQPVGIHKHELPKFAVHRKEFWNDNNQLRSADTAPEPNFPIQIRHRLKVQRSISAKPNQIEISESEYNIHPIHHKKKTNFDLPVRSCKNSVVAGSEKVLAKKDDKVSSNENVSTIKTLNKTFDSISRVSKSVANFSMKISKKIIIRSSGFKQTEPPS